MKSQKKRPRAVLERELTAAHEQLRVFDESLNELDRHRRILDGVDATLLLVKEDAAALCEAAGVLESAKATGKPLSPEHVEATAELLRGIGDRIASLCEDASNDLENATALLESPTEAAREGFLLEVRHSVGWK